MKKFKIPENPYLLFLPFLLVYLVFILVTQKNVLWGDEIRHFDQAKYLLQGFYVTPGPDMQIRNGPGYPLFIAPLIALHVPLLALKLLNGFLLYLSIVFLFKSLKEVVSFRWALIFCVFWGCYYNSLSFISVLYSEVFSAFLVSLILYFLVRSFGAEKTGSTRKYIFLAGFFIGYLALTKVIFGYVILFMLAGCAILWLMNRKLINYKRALTIMLIAAATVTPYLVYTYQVTGRAFYWATSGGDNMYWMTTPYEDEYGSWFPSSFMGTDSVGRSSDHGHQLDLSNTFVYVNNAEDSIKKRHLATYREVSKFKGVEKDEAFKKIVFKNIKQHPVKYLKNCFSNLGRMLFNFPYSYTAQKPGTLARLPLNGIVVLLALFCLIPTFMNWRKIIYPIRLTLFICLLYLGGSLITSSDIRMFTVIVPLLLFWAAFVLQRTLKVNVRFSDNAGTDNAP